MKAKNKKRATKENTLILELEKALLAAEQRETNTNTIEWESELNNLVSQLMTDTKLLNRNEQNREWSQI